MPRTTCSDNCFLPRKTKDLLLAYVSSADLLYTVLNIILNIEKYYQDFCTCSLTIPFWLCPSCTQAHIFRNKQYILFEDCFDFNLIHKVAIQLNEILSDLQKHSRCHFLCKITHKRFHFRLSVFLPAAFAKWTCKEHWAFGKRKKRRQSSLISQLLC